MHESVEVSVHVQQATVIWSCARLHVAWYASVIARRCASFPQLKPSSQYTDPAGRLPAPQLESQAFSSADLSLHTRLGITLTPWTKIRCGGSDGKRSFSFTCSSDPLLALRYSRHNGSPPHAPVAPPRHPTYDLAEVPATSDHQLSAIKSILDNHATTLFRVRLHDRFSLQVVQFALAEDAGELGDVTTLSTYAAISCAFICCCKLRYSMHSIAR